MHPLTRRLIDASPRRLRPGVEVTVGTVDGAIANRLPGLAAEIAFWVLLSLPALVLSVLATVSAVVGSDPAWRAELVDRTLEVASVALTPQALDTLRPALQRLVEGGSLPVVSFGFLAALWVASRAVKVLLVTIALVYGAQRPGGVGHRLLGLIVTVLGLLIGLVLAPLVIAGPGLGEQLGERLDDGAVVAQLWSVLYWPAAVGVATALIASLYHLGAPWQTRWRRDLPGALLATSVWLAGSAALRLYGTWVLGSGSAYGPLAGPIAGLLWIWLTAFAVLLGAQLNARIERRWPTRPAPAESGSALKRLASSTTTQLTDPDEPAPASPPADGS